MSRFPENQSESQQGADDLYEQFVRLFIQHEVGLRAFVHSLLPESTYTDEVIQETSLVLWRKFSGFDIDSSFLNWACTVARFEVLKCRRQIARDRHVFNAELLTLLAEESLAEAERLESERLALKTCLQKLAPRQRELIRAAYSQGVSIKEAASQLGQSATSLYKALNRIRKQLLACVESSIAREELS